MSPTEAPGPGIYEGVPFDDYLGWRYVSNSKLSVAERSMAHFRLGKGVEETESMRFGTLVHAGKLEPLALMERYVVMPDFAARVRKPDGGTYAKPKASAAYRAEVAEFTAAHPGKMMLDKEDYDRLLGVVNALTSHARAREYLDGPGPVEVSIVWDDPATGIRCKGRIDKLKPPARTFADLKTNRDPLGFEWDAARRGYFRQMAFYADGLKILTDEEYQPCLVAAETAPPWTVRAAPVSQTAILRGRLTYQILLREIAESLSTGVWPTAPDPDEWDLPGGDAGDALEVSATGEVTRF